MDNGIRHWIDKFGMLCDINDEGQHDQGDSLSHLSTFFVAYHLTPGLYKAENYRWFNIAKEPMRLETQVRVYLHYAYGCWKRGADKTKWFGENTQQRLSREQLESKFCWDIASNRSYEAREVFWLIFWRGILTLGLGFFFLPFVRRNGATKENHGHKYAQSAPALTKWQEFVLKYRIPFFEVPKGYRNYNLKFPDPIGPEFYALMFRACRFNFLWPLIWIFDIHTFLAAIKDHWDYERGQFDDDTKVRILKTIVQDMRYPTTWTDQAQEILAATEPQKHLDSFYSRHNRAPLNEVLRYLVKHVFGKKRARLR